MERVKQFGGSLDPTTLATFDVVQPPKKYRTKQQIEQAKENEKMQRDLIKAKKDKLVENQFVFSLKALKMDTNKDFMKLIMPSI